MLISQQSDLTSRLSSSSSINEITHFKPAILSFPADWISTSVICFGLCELSIRMSSFPMMSTVHHCRQQRHSVEKVRVDDIVEDLKTPPRLIIPEMTAMTVQAPASLPSTPVTTPVTSPVTTLGVVTIKPICKPVPILGVFRKDSFMSNVPFIFPNQN